MVSYIRDYINSTFLFMDLFILTLGEVKMFYLSLVLCHSIYVFSSSSVMEVKI